MITAERWLLPEGIEEILPPQAARIEALRRTLLDEYRSWGYDLLQPPLAEYLESLLTGVGHDLDLLTFKITDQQNGRMMGVTADRTQQVARMDAHSIPKKGVARYCYCGEILHTKPSNLLSSRSPMQIGAELYGHEGVEADVEVTSLMIASLASAGLENVMVDLGNVSVYQALVDETRLSDSQQNELHSLLRRRALPELEQWLQSSGLDDRQALWFKQLPMMAGGAKELAGWREAFEELPRVQSALDELQQLSDAITQRFTGVRVHVDLAELRDYTYHTGLVFSAFVPGFGQPVARGGRYDHTGEVFGRQRFATGYSSDLKVLAALTAADWSEPAAILAPADDSPQLREKVQKLRAAGERVIQSFNHQPNLEELGCDRQLTEENGRWVVKKIQ